MVSVLDDADCLTEYLPATFESEEISENCKRLTPL